MSVLDKPRKEGDSDLDYKPVTIALAILMERIRGLPQQDRQDLFALAKELPNVQTEEEYKSIGDAMREILEQAPLSVKKMDLSSYTTVPEPGLRKWIDYISARIRTLRTEAGLTQSDLADKAGLPQSHISRLENGQHSPSRATVEKIAKALDQPLSAFDPSA